MIGTGLIEIQDFIQQMAEATAAVLRINVTVFDKKLTRIAGTGRYKKDIGKRQMASLALGDAIEKNKVVCVFNPVTDKYCSKCTQKDECQEVANIAYPIEISGRVEGLLALVAFNERQRLRLIREKEEHVRFLGKMAELIASKFFEYERQVELEQYSMQMANIISSLSDGVLMIDAQGLIMSHNQTALNILGLTKDEMQNKNFREIDPSHPVWKIFSEGKVCFNQEIVWEYKGESKSRYLCSIHPLFDGSDIVAAIVWLKDFETLTRIYHELAGHTEQTGFNTIIGSHPALNDVIFKAKKAAISESAVVITGESGTGKELFARGIHEYSRRKNGPFIAMNCAAIPETLLESELFGYEGGAFTGANTKGKAGKFELANGGTIFLDEIGDLRLSLQSKLLRVLEGNQVTRLGGIKPISINVRIIAATHRDLEEMLGNGEFREDLFYRLSVIPLKIPPLRERRTDIPVLIDCFLDEFKRQNTGREIVFNQEIMDLLLKYHWPGNVRELKNVVEYAVNMTDGEEITVENIPERVQTGFKKQKDKSMLSGNLMPLEEIEKDLLKRGLDIFGAGEQAKGEIAKRLGISKATVYRKLKKHGLS